VAASESVNVCGIRDNSSIKVGSKAGMMKNEILHHNVFLILPSPDRAESLQILRQRDENPPSDLNFDFNGHFLAHHGYYDLAKFTVYTKGRTPAETCAEILALANG
jgi:hypothetical protein